MPIRAILMLVPIFFFAGLCFVIKRFHCHNFDKGPLKRGCLKSFVEATLTWGSWLAMLIIGITVTITPMDDFDYSEYLGPDYRNGYKKDIHTSTYVANHTSALWDSFIIHQYSSFAAVLEANLKSDYILGTIADTLNSLYVKRGGSKEYLNNLIKAIGERQD